MLVAAAREIGGVQIQNRATLGGNVANASPAGDSLPVLLALDAVVIAAGTGGRVSGLVNVAGVKLHPRGRTLACDAGDLELRQGEEVVVDDGAPAAITTDEQRLQQVLRNLLSNAFKFTDRGRVELHVAAPGPDEQRHAVERGLLRSGIAEADPLELQLPAHVGQRPRAGRRRPRGSSPRPRSSGKTRRAPR